MADSRELIIEYTLKPGDVYSPFRWDRDNLARWVTAALLCYIFYDLYNRSGETLRSFDGGNSTLAIVVLLFVFVLLGLLVFPFLRVLAVFRGTPKYGRPTRVTFRGDSILFENEEAKAECKWTLFSQVFETPR